MINLHCGDSRNPFRNGCIMFYILDVVLIPDEIRGDDQRELFPAAYVVTRRVTNNEPSGYNPKNFSKLY